MRMAATSDISCACSATFEAHKARVGGGIAVLELSVALSFKQVATCLCSASFFFIFIGHSSRCDVSMFWCCLLGRVLNLLDCFCKSVSQSVSQSVSHSVQSVSHSDGCGGGWWLVVLLQRVLVHVLLLVWHCHVTWVLILAVLVAACWW